VTNVNIDSFPDFKTAPEKEWKTDKLDHTPLAANKLPGGRLIEEVGNSVMHAFLEETTNELLFTNNLSGLRFAAGVV
jgi:hypothetical protein